MRKFARIGLVAVSLMLPLPALAVSVKPVPAPSGVDAWLSEDHALPMFALAIAFPAGSAYDPPAKPGLAALTASLLDEGAGDLGSDAFKRALEARAIRFSAAAQRDYVVVSLSALSENADEAFRLLALALAHPRFDNEAVERMRASLLADLKQQEEEPDDIAAKAWYAAYFGVHAYGHPVSGTAAGLAAATDADIRDFASAHLVRGSVKLAISGDISETQLRKYLQRLFLPLPARAVPAPPKPQDAGKPGAQTIVMDAAAPVAMFGVPGPMRLDPDFIPAFVANYIFGGGGFSSRLMDQVRDKRGLTYGISTGLTDFRSASVIVGSVQSDKSKIVTALEITKSEMARFAKDGATAAELADAKTYLTGSFPLTFDSNTKIAANLNALQRAGLPVDYVERRNALIQAVTLAKINEMARKYYDPARLVTVIAGTPAPAARSKAPAALGAP